MLALLIILSALTMSVIQAEKININSENIEKIKPEDEINNIDKVDDSSWKIDIFGIVTDIRYVVPPGFYINFNYQKHTRYLHREGEDGIETYHLSPGSYTYRISNVIFPPFPSARKNSIVIIGSD